MSLLFMHITLRVRILSESLEDQESCSFIVSFKYALIILGYSSTDKVLFPYRLI